jgi:hypothetical protein
MDKFVFRCFGHKNIRATHQSTLEFNVDENLTVKGDCIIGVKATNGLSDIPELIKEKIRKTNSKISVVVKINDCSEEIIGEGSSSLRLSGKNAMIIRKSNYICPRTLMINANKAASNLSRQIIELMQNPETEMTVTIQVLDTSSENSKHA